VNENATASFIILPREPGRQGGGRRRPGEDSNEGRAMLETRKLMHGVCAAAVIAAAAAGTAFAQETVAPASATPVPGPMPDVLQKYAPVTAARLRQPEDANWLLFRRTYDGWGYSPLAQITPANVGRLELVWSFATGQVEGHQAPPIVNNGVMFVATPGNQIIALEAKTGDLLWRYKRPLPEDLTAFITAIESDADVPKS